MFFLKTCEVIEPLLKKFFLFAAAMKAQQHRKATNSEKRHTHHQFIARGGSANRPKYTTRHLAALDFLLNIPMSSEADIKRTGVRNMMRLNEHEEGDIEANNLLEALSPSATGVPGDDPNDFVSKKLRGPEGLCARLPAHLLYYMSVQSAAVRQWEEKILTMKPEPPIIVANTVTPQPVSSQPLLASRHFYSRARSYPTLVSSVIKYDAGKEHAKLAKIKAGDAKGMEVFEVVRRDWRGYSYKPLFKSMVELYADRSSSTAEYNPIFFDRGYLYDPNFVDDPNYNHGSHRYVLQRSAATGPVISSIILFVNKKELKESLNEKFREIHPHLPPSLTLSKLRNLKKITVLACLNIGMEVSTVAIAVICFERLCLKGIVTKSNRRLSMAVCLLLAFKFNEQHILSSAAHVKKRLGELFEFFDDEWELTKKQVLDAEFGAYVQLGFSLHFPSRHIYLVYTRLLKLVGKKSNPYLGEEMTHLYVQDLREVDRSKRNAAAVRAAAEVEQQQQLLLVLEQKQEEEEEERKKRYLRRKKGAESDQSNDGSYDGENEEANDIGEDEDDDDDRHGYGG